MNTKQAGLAHLIAVLVIVLMGAITLAGWLVYSNRQQSMTNSVGQTTNPYKNWKTYIDSRNGFSIQHPEEWLASASSNKSLAPWSNDPNTEFYNVVIAPKYDYTGRSDDTGLVITITNLSVEKMLNIGDSSGVRSSAKVGKYEATKIEFKNGEAVIFADVEGKTYGFAGAPVARSAQKLSDVRVIHSLSTFKRIK